MTKTLMRLHRPFAAFVFLCAGATASAQTAVPLTVAGNQATGIIQLGSLLADLTIDFEQVSGLSPTALTATARVVNPLDTGVLSRLVSGAGLVLSFPVLLQIEPAPGSALSFRGVTTVSLHTHNLIYTPDTRLVLHSAHAGGPFRDITSLTAPGSYRAGGSTGTFSEFLIVIDLRPIDTVISGKYTALQQILASHGAGLPPDVKADLHARLAESLARFHSGQTNDAITSLDGFSAAVEAGSGTTIPDEWRADGSVVNVAGLLRAAADTLRYSLAWKASHS
jgi:hypothetical protein